MTIEYAVVVNGEVAWVIEAIVFTSPTHKLLVSSHVKFVVPAPPVLQDCNFMVAGPVTVTVSTRLTWEIPAVPVLFKLKYVA